MADSKVWFVVSLTINPGQFETFDRLSRQMSAETAKEPGTQAYTWCLSDDRSQCKLVEEYVDSAAVMAHITGPVVQQLLPQLLQVSAISGFEVYGNPGPEGSAALTSVGATIFGFYQGFSR